VYAGKTRMKDEEKKSLVIYHLTFLICHLGNRFRVQVSVENSTAKTSFENAKRATRHLQLETRNRFLKMTNEKCQMIYDQ